MNGEARRVRGLLLAAGVGSRLRPLTDTVPKCLVPIADWTPLDLWVDRLADAGVREARINTHSLAEVVRAHIDQVNKSGRLKLSEAYEPALLGSAGTIAANADLADETDEVFIVYADNISDINLRPLIAFHRHHGDPLTMVLFRAPEPRACGIAEMDAACCVTSFVEKPDQPASDLANAGLYVASKAAYREIAGMRAFDIARDVLPRFLGRMRGWVWGGYYLDIGTPEALERARLDAASILGGRREVKRAVRQPAVFLDRDGTLIEHVHYLADPALVRLLPGATEALRHLEQAGFARVLVTNQSAIGRGMLSEDRLADIHAELNRQLAIHGASIDAIYYCADVPGCDDRTTVENPDRKPGPGMLLRAAAELGLDLSVSWMIGDLISDVLAGINAGCRSILVQSGQTSSAEVESVAGRVLIAPDFATAVSLILDDRRTRR
jgi:D,D-heptose 1,7-bisphosphate phosphatase